MAFEAIAPPVDVAVPRASGPLASQVRIAERSRFLRSERQSEEAHDGAKNEGNERCCQKPSRAGLCAVS